MKTQTKVTQFKQMPYHHIGNKTILVDDMAMLSVLQSRNKYPHSAKVISPTAQNPIHPQNVLHSGVTNSSGRTKFTTRQPTKSETTAQHFLYHM